MTVMRRAWKKIMNEDTFGVLRSENQISLTILRHAPSEEGLRWLDCDLRIVR